MTTPLSQDFKFNLLVLEVGNLCVTCLFTPTFIVIFVTKSAWNDYCNYRRSCFFCVDFIYANYARERKFA